MLGIFENINVRKVLSSMQVPERLTTKKYFCFAIFLPVYSIENLIHSVENLCQMQMAGILCIQDLSDKILTSLQIACSALKKYGDAKLFPVK